MLREHVQFLLHINKQTNRRNYHAHLQTGPSCNGPPGVEVLPSREARGDGHHHFVRPTDPVELLPPSRDHHRHEKAKQKGERNVLGADLAPVNPAGEVLLLLTVQQVPLEEQMLTHTYVCTLGEGVVMEFSAEKLPRITERIASFACSNICAI